MSKKLLDDEDFVLTAARIDQAVRYFDYSLLSERLKSDQKFTLKLLRENPDLYRHVRESSKKTSNH